MLSLNPGIDGNSRSLAAFSCSILQSEYNSGDQPGAFRCKHAKKRAEWLVMQELNSIPAHLHFHSSHRPTSSSDGSHRAVVPKSLSDLVRDLFGDTVRPVVDTLLVFDAPRSVK